jgi:hypothetical protein
VTRRRRGTSAHIGAIALVLMEMMSSRKKIIVETGGPLVNRLSSASVRMTSWFAWQRVATSRQGRRRKVLRGI